MMASLNIDGSAMEAMVAKAVMETLSGEQREQLLKDAIASLLVTPKASGSYYGVEPKSPLREMFEQAAKLVAQKHIYQQLEKDAAFHSIVLKLFDTTAKKLMDGETGEKLASAMAEAFVKGMRLDSY